MFYNGANMLNLMSLTGCGTSYYGGSCFGSSYSMLDSIFSPATQMIFAGTGTEFDLSGYNVYYGNGGCGSSSSSSNGWLWGLLGAGLLAGGVNLAINSVRQTKAEEASEYTNLTLSIASLNGEIDNLVKQLGSDATRDNYSTYEIDKKFGENVDKSDNAFNESANKVKSGGELYIALDTAKTNYTKYVTNYETELKQIPTDDPNYANKKAQLDSLKENAEKKYNEAKEAFEAEEAKTKEPNGELYKAKVKADNEKETEEKRIADLKAKIRVKINNLNELQSKKDSINLKNELEDKDGTMISRLFGNSVDTNNANLGLNLKDGETVGKSTMQKILCRYKKGTLAEKKNIQAWLKDENNKKKIENYDNYSGVINSILSDDLS